MIPLASDIENITQQILVLNTSDDSRTAIAELEAILLELEPLEASLRDAVGVRQGLNSFPDKFYFDKNLALEQAIKEFLEQYENFTDSWKDINFKIRQDEVVSNFTSEVTPLLSTLKSGNEDAWDKWVDTLKAKFPATETQIESVANVPENRALVLEYTGTKERFNAFVFGGVPVDPEGLDEFILGLESETDSLVKIGGRIKFDLPKNILKFYKDLDTNGSFPLKSYDIDTMEWLEENNGLENLKITKGY